MWLEEMAWLWLPIAGGVAIWMIWGIVMLKTEVRALRHRLAQIQAESAARVDHEETEPWRTNG